ncbi:hypothetical protein ACFPM1_15475 [Halorubrum rubrum]|uniref:Uncharacterized protein n=1 Tax=Halorubrum rubrum TaxID=1126240 RepID=A0ABD5R5C4_9EURY|nr:hypothetical protein [Halorubrum rubrum]
MSDDDGVRRYFEPLTTDQRESLRARMERYRDGLEGNGYELALAEGVGGLFAGVLVIDDERGRAGFLETNGAVTWLDGSTGGLGALGSAIAQNHTDALDAAVDVPEGVDIE